MEKTVTQDLTNIFYSTIAFNMDSNDPLNNDMHLVVLAWQHAVYRAEEYQSVMADQPRMVWNIMADILRNRKGPVGELVESIIDKALRTFMTNPIAAVPSSYDFADGEVAEIVDKGEKALNMKYMQLILQRIQELAAVNHYVYNPVSLSSAASLAKLKSIEKAKSNQDSEGWTQVGHKKDQKGDGKRNDKLLTNLATQLSMEGGDKSVGKSRVTSDMPKPFASGEGPECKNCGLSHTPPKTGCDIWNGETRQLSIKALLKMKRHMRLVGTKVCFNFNFTDHLRDYCMPAIMGIDNKADRNRLISDLIAAAAALPSNYLGAPKEKVNNVTTKPSTHATSNINKTKQSDGKPKTHDKGAAKLANQATVQSTIDESSEDEDWSLKDD
jgi:hypothetical protein